MIGLLSQIIALLIVFARSHIDIELSVYFFFLIFIDQLCIAWNSGIRRMLGKNHVAERVDGSHKAQIDVRQSSPASFCAFFRRFWKLVVRALKPFRNLTSFNQTLLKPLVEFIGCSLSKSNGADLLYRKTFLHHRYHSFHQHRRFSGTRPGFHKKV